MTSKVCKRCSIDKPTAEFRADNRYKDGFGSWCRQCHRERGNEWSKENRRARSKRATENRKANIDAYRAINRLFKARHKERLAKQHADWASRNRGKRNASSAKRKAAKLRATPRWANHKKIAAIYKHAARLTDFTGIQMHVDHIVPLQGESVCGLHWEENLQIIPASENVSKRNKWGNDVEEAYRQPDFFVEKPTPAEQIGMDL